MQLDLEVLMVFQKIVTLYGCGFDSHFRAIGIVQLVRTIEGNAGSNPATNLGLVLTVACRLTDFKSVFQSASLLKRCTRKRTELSLSATFLQ